MTFPERLRQLREERGLSQAQLAKVFGVDSCTVSIWERGVRLPKGKTIDDIAEFFDVSVSYLMGGEKRDRFPRHDDDEAWVDEHEIEMMRDMFYKIARLSYSSTLVAKATIEALYKHEKDCENLITTDLYDIGIKVKLPKK